MRIVVADFNEIGLQKLGVPEANIPALLNFIRDLPDPDQRWIYRTLLRPNPALPLPELQQQYQAWKQKVEAQQPDQELRQWALSIHPEFVDWLVFQRQKNQLPKEDEDKAIQTLRAFSVLKNNPQIPKQSKDINQYPNLNALYDFVQNTQSAGQAQQVLDAADPRMVYNQDGVQVLKITEVKDAVAIAQETNWCVKFDSTALSYLNYGPLYFIFVDGQKTALASPAHKQIKDRADRTLSDYSTIVRIHPALAALDSNPGTGDFANVNEVLVEGQEAIAAMSAMTPAELNAHLYGDPEQIKFVTPELLRRPETAGIIAQALTKIFPPEMTAYDFSKSAFNLVYEKIPTVAENHPIVRQTLVNLLAPYLLNRGEIYQYLHNELKKDRTIQDSTMQFWQNTLTKWTSDRFLIDLHWFTNLPGFAIRRLANNLPPGCKEKIEQCLQDDFSRIRNLSPAFRQQFPEIDEMASQSLRQSLSNLFSDDPEANEKNVLSFERHNAPDEFYWNPIRRLYTSDSLARDFLEKATEDPALLQQLREYYLLSLTKQKVDGHQFDDLNKLFKFAPEEVLKLIPKQAQGYANYFNNLVEKLKQPKPPYLASYELVCPSGLRTQPILQPVFGRLFRALFAQYKQLKNADPETLTAEQAQDKDKDVKHLKDLLTLVPVPDNVASDIMLQKDIISFYKFEFDRIMMEIEDPIAALRRIDGALPANLSQIPYFRDMMLTRFYKRCEIMKENFTDTLDVAESIYPRTGGVCLIFETGPCLKFLRQKLIAELFDDNTDPYDLYRLFKLISKEETENDYGNSPLKKKILSDPATQEAVAVALLKYSEEKEYSTSREHNDVREYVFKTLTQLIQTAIWSRNQTAALQPLLVLNLLSPNSPTYVAYVNLLKSQYLPVLLKRFPNAAPYVPRNILQNATWYGIAKVADVVTAAKLLTLYRGELASGQQGNYFTTDHEWARQFTQSGRDHEIRHIQVDPNLIYRATVLPEASGTDEQVFDQTIAEARRLGKKAIWVNEGQGQPNSVFIFDKSLIRP